MERKPRKYALWAGLFLLGMILALMLTKEGRALRALYQNGTIQAMITDPPDRKYLASRTGNLKAIYTAMMLYHDSEDKWPAAAGWMDAIENRLRTNDMPEAEARRKLVRPNLPPGSRDAYGYGMNDAASGKYKGDVKDPKTILVYESKATDRNHHGDPKAENGMAITIDGEIVGQ